MGEALLLLDMDEPMPLRLIFALLDLVKVIYLRDPSTLALHKTKFPSKVFDHL
jgi:hypothetical protein